MKHLFILILFGFTSLTFAQSEYNEIASRPGAFSRMGFGARGIGMGNAMSAVIDGNLVSYYNPAAIVFQDDNSFQTSYSFLSQDRSLNYLSFTRRIEFGKINKDGTVNKKPRSTAGISIGVINAGVGDFAQRDNQGIETGTLSTYENQFFIGFANKFSEKFVIGVNAKFYYTKLYEDITTTTFGLDFGAIYRINNNITLSAVVSDMMSKYKWDTTSLYGLDGTNTVDQFPLLTKVGVSYMFENPKMLASIEIEHSDANTNYLRFGIEYNIFESLFIRGGLDKFDLSNTSVPSRPAIGFSYFHKFSTVVIGFDYAFVIEPYSSHDQHIIGVDINF